MFLSVLMLYFVAASNYITCTKENLQKFDFCGNRKKEKNILGRTWKIVFESSNLFMTVVCHTIFWVNFWIP